jgi:hypothetical protein
MSHLLKSAKLTIDMIQRRDDMRLLLGSNYAAQSEECRKILRAAVKAWNMPIMGCALKIAKDMNDHGHDPSMVFPPCRPGEPGL